MCDSKKLFEMRKNGQSAQALPMARRLYQKEQNDEWVQRALGWCLYDAVKSTLAQNNLREAEVLLQEARRIPIARSDETLRESLSRLQGRLFPGNNKLQQAETAQKEGEIDRSLQLYRELFAEYPGYVQVRDGYGWALYKKLKILSDSNSWQQLYPLYREYFGLHYDQGSQLHYTMLFPAFKTWEFNDNFIEFIQWWGTDQLKPEDWKPKRNPEYQRQQVNVSGKVPVKEYFPSLAESLLKRLRNTAKRTGKWQKLEGMLHYCERTVQLGCDAFSRYYFCQILVECGRISQAAPMLIEMLRTQQDAFYLWALLAGCYSDARMQQQCYAKAALLHPELRDTYLEKLRSAAPGDKVINEEIVKEMAAAADQLLIRDLPLYRCNLVKSFKDKAGIDRSVILVETGTELFVKTQKIPLLYNAVPGAPFSCKYFRNSADGKVHLLSLEAREGKAYDALTEMAAVVVQINYSKKIVSFRYSESAVALLHLKEESELEEYAVLDRYYIKSVPGKDPAVSSVVVHRRDESADVKNLLRDFQGEFVLRDGNRYGFVEMATGSVYVPSGLCKQLHDAADFFYASHNSPDDLYTVKCHGIAERFIDEKSVSRKELRMKALKISYK